MVIAPGQNWTFVHPDGHTTDYVVETVESDQAPQNLVRLLNPATGKHAQVTCKWLSDGPLEGRGHWRPPDEVPPF